MEYRLFELGELSTNCYLVWAGREAGVIDPGGPVEKLIDWITQNELDLKWIVNTHGHMDHIAGNRPLKEKYGVDICIHEGDREMLTSAVANFSAFFGFDFSSPDADRILQDGDRVHLGEEHLTVIAVPGHSQGGIALYAPGILFSGDALFQASIGRTDFPGGNHEELIKNIKERLLVLPPETVVLPGHGPSSTIGQERKYNPFLF